MLLSKKKSNGKISRFNLQTKTLLLCYGNVNNLFLQDLVNGIHRVAKNLKVKVASYVATIKDGNRGRRQGHIYVSFSREIWSKNPKVFDIKGFHPVVFKPRTQQNAIKYVIQGITGKDSLHNNLFMSSSTYDDLQIIINGKEHYPVLTTVETQTAGGQIQAISSTLTDTNGPCKYCDNPPVAVKRGRGRPKKAINRIIDVNLPVVVKKKGRPRKTTHKEP